MAKLISLMHISFDGFAAGPSGEMDWITMDQEIFEYVSRYISKIGTGVYGPKTFHMMESYWPAVARGDVKAPATVREWAVKKSG